MAVEVCELFALIADGFYILHEPTERASTTDWCGFNGSSCNKKVHVSQGLEGFVWRSSTKMKVRNEQLLNAA